MIGPLVTVAWPALMLATTASGSGGRALASVVASGSTVTIVRGYPAQ